MKTVGFAVLSALFGFVTVIASELAVMQWLGVAPFDVTGSFFLAAVIPAHLLVVGLLVTLIAPVLRHNPNLNVGIYCAFVVTMYAVMLNALANPAGDITRYVVSIAFAMGVWLLVNRNRIFTEEG